MATALIGLGNMGRAIATQLVRGREHIIVASRDSSQAESFAKQLGVGARATSVDRAFAEADVIVFAVSFDTIKELISSHQEQLSEKVVVDPSNPIRAAEGGRFVRTLPDGVSAGSVIARLLPPSAHYVKAFGSLSAKALADSVSRNTSRAVLFYAADDLLAARTADRLISAAGFDPVKAGGVESALRIEALGDLHQLGGLKGQVLNAEQARTAIQAKA